jgi:hypothetical protein
VDKRAAAKVQPGDALVYARCAYEVLNVYPFPDAGPRPPYFDLLTNRSHGTSIRVTYLACQTPRPDCPTFE